MTTIKDVERIRSAAWLLEDKELAAELKMAHGMYAMFKKSGDTNKSEFYRLYYWAIRNEMVMRFK